MLIKICNDITKISDDKDVNSQNYMEGLDHINNLYTFLNSLKLAVPLDEVKFLPSFKRKFIVEKLGITSTDKENEMKVFRVQSPLFIEDKKKTNKKVLEKVTKELSKICEKINLDKDVITFYMA
jgi:CRISPR/Cas system endoribonuclease Cas6 (RAMP superfamily)